MAEVAGGDGSEDATSRGVSICSRGKDGALVHARKLLKIKFDQIASKETRVKLL